MIKLPLVRDCLLLVLNQLDDSFSSVSETLVPLTGCSRTYKALKEFLNLFYPNTTGHYNTV